MGRRQRRGVLLQLEDLGRAQAPQQARCHRDPQVLAPFPPQSRRSLQAKGPIPGGSLLGCSTHAPQHTARSLATPCPAVLASASVRLGCGGREQWARRACRRGGWVTQERAQQQAARVAEAPEAAIDSERQRGSRRAAPGCGCDGGTVATAGAAGTIVGKSVGRRTEGCAGTRRAVCEDRSGEGGAAGRREWRRRRRRLLGNE
jgi:hypothetical protein